MSACDISCAFQISMQDLVHFIETPAFINEHIQYHHHLTYNKCNLLILDCGGLTERAFCRPVRFFSISGGDKNNYQVPPVPVKLELDSPCFLEFRDNAIDMVTRNGVICLHIRDLLHESKKLSVCLWNPATRKLRALPESPFAPSAAVARYHPDISLGFGFDVRTNDYKVVGIVTVLGRPNLTQVEVYSLNADCWTTVDAVRPVDMVKTNPKVPYRNGLYCWSAAVKVPIPKAHAPLAFSPDIILSFDFSKEVFGTMSLPDAVSVKSDPCPVLAIIKDDIACITKALLPQDERDVEIWVLDNLDFKLSYDGTVLFFIRGSFFYMYNLVTQEIEDLPGRGFRQPDLMLPFAEYKESLVSVESRKGRAMIPTCVLPRTDLEQKH